MVARFAGSGKTTATRALATLPSDTTDVTPEVMSRRDAARTALEHARATLWTTETTGFPAGQHILPRALRVLDVPPTK